MWGMPLACVRPRPARPGVSAAPAAGPRRPEGDGTQGRSPTPRGPHVGYASGLRAAALGAAGSERRPLPLVGLRVLLASGEADLGVLHGADGGQVIHVGIRAALGRLRALQRG